MMKYLLVLISLWSLPAVGFTASCDLREIDFKGLATCIYSEIFNPIIFLIFGFGVVTFMYGILKYVSKGASKEERAKGSYFMLYAIFGLTMMIVFWGFVSLLVSVFSGPTGNPPIAPPIPVISS